MIAEFIKLKGGEISCDLFSDLLEQSLGGASFLAKGIVQVDDC